MLKPYREYERLSNDAYAEDLMTRGTVVSVRSDGRNIVAFKCNKTIPYGISLTDVVNIDLGCQMLISNVNEVLQGSKILVLHSGILITSNIDKSFKGKQLLTPVRVDLRNGKLTTKKHKFSSEVVGKTLSLVDGDGFIKIRFDFT